MSVKIPDLPEQKRIVDILSSTDKKIELTNKQIELMKDYKKGLLQGMFI